MKSTIFIIFYTCGPWLGQVQPLIGYDCETPGLNVTTIAIDEVAECSPERSDYDDEPLVVQVVQREEIKSQLVKTCLIEVDRTIYHCGMYSHSSIVAGGVSAYIHTLGSDECRATHRHRSLDFYGHRINKLQINGTTSASVVMFGTVTDNGACSGVTFTENDRTWPSVVVQGALRITLTETRAKVKLNSNEISIPGGIVCSFLEGYCTDSTYGETVWDLQPEMFCKDVATLYRGEARRVTDRKRGIAYIVVQKEDRVFAVTLQGETEVCSKLGWLTEHPRIIVVNVTQGGVVGDQHGTTPENTDLLAYVNSKLLYVEQASKRQLEYFYIDAVYRRCQLHREILKNRLLTAPLSPSAVGWVIKQQRGYIGRVLGEVLYLLKCTPRPALLRRSDRCYNELPVTVNNQSRFLSPLTHIILVHAEEIDCSPLTPPMFYVNNRWIGLSPEPALRDHPLVLQAEREDTLLFEPIRPLGGGGLYTNAEVSRSQRLILFGTERKAVENVLVRKITGEPTDSQGLQPTKIFDEEGLKSLARSTMKQVWGWFTDLGVFVSGLMGIYVVFQLLKYVLGVSLNGWQIYRTIGCGVTLIAALWDTLTMWVLHRHLTKQGPEDAELEEVTVAPTQPQPQAPNYMRAVSAPPQASAPLLRHWTDTNA